METVSEPLDQNKKLAQQWRLAVIVLNYRTPQLVLDCLATLEPEIEVGLDCVVVVDNQSGDDSAEKIQTHITQNNWSWATLITAPTNNGFSAGNNHGMQHLRAEAYFLINSDTLIRPGALAALRNALALYPQAGIISPRLEWPDETPQISCFRHISPISEFLEVAKTGPISKLLHRYEVAIEVSNFPIHPQWTSFAAVLLRGEAVEQVGWMDEGYFMYFEDVDYCRRIRAAGWDIVHWPLARVVHLRGGSSNVKAAAAARKRRPRYFYAARSRYLAKFYKGKKGLWGSNVLWGFGRIISKTREQLGNKAPHTCAHEGRDIWTNWRDPLNPTKRGI